MMRSLLSTFLLTCFSLAQDATLPADSTQLISVEGRGVQIYTCSRQKETLLWVLQAPAATLFDRANQPVGEHGAGPTWKWKDGSAVQGTMVRKQPSPDPESIPWLLLSATPANSAGGVLTPVTWIRRSATRGGIAPAKGCDPRHEQAVARIAYSATYTFYVAGHYVSHTD